MKTTFPLRPVLCTALVFISGIAWADSGFRPAMITNGSDSVAAHLHYPKKAKAAKEQAAIPFYCEVQSSGKASHLMLYGANDETQFRMAVLQALTDGRFQPAMAGGKAVPVILGGTAIFMFRGEEPIVAIALSTSEKAKLASFANFIQPQMISSSADFRRKIWNSRFDSDIHLLPGVRPRAIALAQVDAQGNLSNVKISAESPQNAGWGPLLLKGFKGAKFIPALSDGKTVAGQFDFICNYDFVYNPDYGAETGSHISRDDADR